jgi:polyhydroxybutyrate depolymerase
MRARWSLVAAASLGLLAACSTGQGAESGTPSSALAGAGGAPVAATAGAGGVTASAGSALAMGGGVVENAGTGGVGGGGSAGASSGGAGESGSASPQGGAAGMSSAGNAAVASNGCGMQPTDPAGQFVFDKTIMVDGVQRKYNLRLPTAYDQNRPYRTIFSLHGCGSHHDQLINMQAAMGFDAIIIAPEQLSGNCFDDQSSMSKDLPVFDALVAWAEESLCVDKSRIFSIGFSSGSWMTNILGCQRANVIRAKANVSGGLTGAVDVAKDCKGNVAGIFLHDKDDTQNTLAMGMHARDALLQQNGCSTTTTPYDDVPANTAGLCVQYDGCKAGDPVVWCQTSGINHDPQQMRSPELFWRFLSKF